MLRQTVEKSQANTFLPFFLASFNQIFIFSCLCNISLDLLIIVESSMIKGLIDSKLVRPNS